MGVENFPKTNFEMLIENRRAEGWHYMGLEGLTKTKFSKEAKFEQVPDQTEDSIKEKYLNDAKQQDPTAEFEVDLVLDENTEKLRSFKKISTDGEYQDILTRLRDEDKSYFVFVRKKS